MVLSVLVNGNGNGNGVVLFFEVVLMFGELGCCLLYWWGGGFFDV